MRVLMIVALLTAGCVGAVSAQPDTAEQDQVSAADGALILEGLGPELSEIEVDLAVSKIYFEQLSNPSTSDEPLTDEVRARIVAAVERAGKLGVTAGLARMAATDPRASSGTGWPGDRQKQLMSAARRVVRLNTARYSLAAADGDDDEAVRAVREVLWLVRLANSLGGNINRQNGIAIELHASEGIRVSLVRGQVDAEVVSMLLSMISGLDKPGQASPSLTEAVRAAEVQRLGTQTLLAIECFKAGEGEPPSDLGALVPEYLDEIVSDSFTGEPLLYRRDASAPLGYVLYSAGLDGGDDGAKPYSDPRFPQFAFREDGAESDFVFAPLTAKGD